MTDRHRRASGDDPHKHTRGGAQWARAKNQFWALYRKIGSFSGTCYVAGFRGETDGIPKWDDDALIRWPNENRPALKILNIWAETFDDGNAEIDPMIEQAILARYEASIEYQRTAAMVRIIEENAQNVSYISEKLRNGEATEKDTPWLQHSNNGVQNTLRAPDPQTSVGVPKAKKKIKSAKPKEPLRLIDGRSA